MRVGPIHGDVGLSGLEWISTKLHPGLRSPTRSSPGFHISGLRP